MISFSHVTFGYQPDRVVLRDFSWTVPDGARRCLLGPSGRGKTTVLRLLLGLETPTAGQITGTAGLRFSAVFQEDRLLPQRTARQNVALFSDETAGRDMLIRLGLENVLDSLPDQLSGGQRRRVALARALAHPFDVLVLDEALTGLDEDSARRCLAVIDEALGDRTLVMVSHDEDHALVLGAEAVEL